MPQKITFDEVLDRDNLVSHAILNIGSDTVMELVDKATAEGRRHYMVSLVVDGVEVSLDPFFDHIEASLDEIVEKRARSLLEAKFDEMVEKLEAVKRGMLNELSDFPHSDW